MPEEDPIDFSKDDELVPVVYGRNEDEAEEYRQLLEDHEIEATVGYDGLEEREDDETNGRAMSRGIPVLVPDSLLDEASEIIADREDTEEFEVGEEFEDEDEDEEDEFSMEIEEGELGPDGMDYLGDDEDEVDEESYFDEDDEDYFDEDLGEENDEDDDL